jgi:hypothetical protein
MEAELLSEATQMQDRGVSPGSKLYNAVPLGICRNGKTDYSLKILVNMVSDG